MLIVSFAVAIVLGVLLGVGLAATRNISSKEQFDAHHAALPTKILDINDREITEFFGEQSREPITIDQVPQHLVDALLTREDRNFYSHHGFSLRGLVRALFNIMTGRYVSGASTLTQQLAGRLYADRTDISIKRKLVELWWAVQMERRYTKQEITGDVPERDALRLGHPGRAGGQQVLLQAPRGAGHRSRSRPCWSSSWQARG